MSFGESWYLSVVPMLIGVAMQLANTNKMAKTHALMNGTIRSWFHLRRVRDAINLSMRLAIIYIGLFAGMFVVLLTFVLFSGMSITTLATHMFLFGIFTLPVGLWAKGIEGRVKNLAVQAEDPEIERRFNDYVKQWGEPRLKLQEDDGDWPEVGQESSSQERKQA
jgi:hypothetical protein